jgi:formaldehyde-activating enzyme involved in methanogenesis
VSGGMNKQVWDKVPKELIDLEIPLDLMIKVSEFVHFATSRKHSSYEKYVIEGLDIILSSDNLPEVNKKYIIYFLSELRPIQ